MHRRAAGAGTPKVDSERDSPGRGPSWCKRAGSCEALAFSRTRKEQRDDDGSIGNRPHNCQRRTEVCSCSWNSRAHCTGLFIINLVRSATSPSNLLDQRWGRFHSLSADGGGEEEHGLWSRSAKGRRGGALRSSISRGGFRGQGCRFQVRQRERN